MSATIPIASDVAALVGRAAEQVENRSLLLDKFSFHKRWPVVEEQTRRGRGFIKWDEASRWSFIRIADGAAGILHREAQEKRRKANGRDVEPENRDRLLGEAKIAESLANVRWDSRELLSLRNAHTRRFLSLFRSAYGERAAVTIGRLEGRLAINLADSLIQNAGICLDRLFGLPFIPGSAIKGVVRHTALDEVKAAPASERDALLALFCSVFGTSENDFQKGDLRGFRSLPPRTPADGKGAVSFLPAYPVNDCRIVVDLTNVHYPEYYRTGRPDAQSNERPQPNPLPAVEAGAEFAFFIVLNGLKHDPALLATARRWLEKAITERGLGAKTASGYGWFSIQPQVLAALEAAELKEREAREEARRAKEEEELKRQEEEERLRKLPPEALAKETLLAMPDDQFAAFAKAIKGKTEVEQRALVDLLSTHKEKRDRWKTWKKKKPDIATVVAEAAAALNLPPLP